MNSLVTHHLSPRKVIMFTIKSCPLPKPDIVGRNVDNESVLVLPQQGQVKVLNQVGARIWELLNGKRTVKEIATILSQEYAVSQAAAEKDTLEFVNDLGERNMLEVEK